MKIGLLAEGDRAQEKVKPSAPIMIDFKQGSAAQFIPGEQIRSCVITYPAACRRVPIRNRPFWVTSWVGSLLCV